MIFMVVSALAGPDACCVGLAKRRLIPVNRNAGGPVAHRTTPLRRRASRRRRARPAPIVVAEIFTPQCSLQPAARHRAALC
jgi:hypothetical protein